MSVLNAEEQGAIPADEGEDEDEGEGEGEDEDVPEHNKEADAADPRGLTRKMRRKRLRQKPRIKRRAKEAKP